MTIRILGAAAGGGLPQWNCRCRQCQAARSGDIAPSTQCSIALVNDKGDVALVGATPDLREQMAANAVLWPRRSPRHTPIRSVIVTNGEIDGIAGLLNLREMQAFRLYGQRTVLDEIAANPVFDALSDCVERIAVEAGEAFSPLPGYTVTMVDVPGKVPLYREGDAATAGLDGGNSALRIERGGRVAWFIPACAAMPDSLLDRLQSAEVVLFDGTAWSNRELIEQGLGEKTASRMGHMAMSGDGGSLQALASLNAATRVFVHINNSNPVWLPDSTERRALDAAGWQVGHDGMEIAF